LRSSSSTSASTNRNISSSTLNFKQKTFLYCIAPAQNVPEEAKIIENKLQLKWDNGKDVFLFSTGYNLREMVVNIFNLAIYFHRIRRMSTNKNNKKPRGKSDSFFFTSSYTDPILQAIQRSHF
jgi:hypothetical protein